MYNDLTRQPSAKRQPFSIRLDPIPVHEKVVYIESVCAALIDSRFGPGRSRPIVIDIKQKPELEPAVFYDLTVDGPVPCYTIHPDSEMARRYVADIVRHELSRAGRSSIPAPGPTPLGRGSP